MNPFLKYGSLVLAIISFMDVIIAFTGGSDVSWSVLGFDVSRPAYIGFKMAAGIALLFYGLGWVGKSDDVIEK